MWITCFHSVYNFLTLEFIMFQFRNQIITACLFVPWANSSHCYTTTLTFDQNVKKLYNYYSFNKFFYYILCKHYFPTRNHFFFKALSASPEVKFCLRMLLSFKKKKRICLNLKSQPRLILKTSKFPLK